MGRLRYEEIAITLQSALDTKFDIPSEWQNAGFAKLIVTFGAGTSAGAVVIEESDDVAYTGVWAILGTATWSAASKKTSVAVQGPFKRLRVRISTAVVGGTVSARVMLSD